MANVRPAVASDRPDLYEICLQTGDSGSDATGLYDDPDLLGHVYVGPYLAVPATLAFVAEDGSGVAGYVLAAVDTAAFEAACERSWWPPLRATHPRNPAAGGRDGALVEVIHQPPRTPDWITRDWPAHLHIDLLPRLQGSGMGRGLMAAALDALRGRGVSGVHLGVAPANRRAIGFYRHLGFERLAAGEDAIVMGHRLGATNGSRD